MLKKVLESMLPHPKYKVTRLDEAIGGKYSSLSDWKAAAKDRGFVVRSAVHPKDGSDNNYWTAKDSEGNDKGHFDNLSQSKMPGMLHESAGSITADIKNLLDKHIAEYNKRGGAEWFANKVGHAATQLGRMHNMDHKAATKAVNDYVDAHIIEGVVAEADAPYHRVAVTVSEPDHPAVTKRKEQVQKFVRVKGDKADAVEKAKKHFKNKGYKVHGAEYVEGYAISHNEGYNVVTEAGRSKKEINQDINAVELKIHDIWRKGGTVPETDPLNKKLRDLKAERKRADFKIVKEDELMEMNGGQRAAYKMGKSHGVSGVDKIDPVKSFGYDNAAYYNLGYREGTADRTASDDWHEKQSSGRRSSYHEGVETKENTEEIKKLKAKIAAMKVKLSAAKKSPNLDECVIHDLESNIDTAEEQIKQLSK